MPLAAYPNLGWLIRAVRVLPVVAVAATAGGIIGGFTIFAIDSALTWQPRPEFRADSQAAIGEQQGTRPIRIVGGEATKERLDVLREADHVLQEEIRRNWPFLRDRRIDAYGDITRRFID